MTILPGYIPPRKYHSLIVVIHKNAKCMSIKLSIPKDVHVTKDIMPNLKKLAFTDHDLGKFLEQKMSWYMTSL